MTLPFDNGTFTLRPKPETKEIAEGFLAEESHSDARRCCSMRAELLLDAGRTAAEFEQIVARKRHESGRERRQGCRCYLNWSPSFIELASEYLEAVKNQIANDRRPSFLPQN